MCLLGRREPCCLSQAQATQLLKSVCQSPGSDRHPCILSLGGLASAQNGGRHLPQDTDQERCQAMHDHVAKPEGHANISIFGKICKQSGQ